MEVTIYSTSTCTACHALTQWLQKQGVDYKKLITDEDPAAMAEFMSVNEGSIGVPFTVIKDDAGSISKVAGFQIGEFKRILGL